MRDDRPFVGPAPPAATFYYSRNRSGEHPQAHLEEYAGIFQADAYGAYTQLYEANRKPGPLVEAACWVHARRPFFILADVAANARRKSQGETASPISPLALEVVRRIDALFDIERSINGQSAERRRTVRQELSALLVTDDGCASSGPNSRAAMISPKLWTTCSSAGRPLPASSTMAASASRTMPSNGHCAVLPLAESHGCSPVPTAVDSALRRYIV